MQTRRDQLQAYRFQNRRALAALVTGQPNVLEAPMRRLTVTTLSGIMIAILIAIVFGIIAIIRPSAGDSWKKPGAVIVDQDNNATYVYIRKVLHPVLNNTSAVLAVSGTSTVTQVKVSSSDIAGATYGSEIGIPGVPLSLPPKSSLLNYPMSACSVQHDSGTKGPVAQVTLHLGSTGATTSVPDDRGVFVTAPDKPATYLLYDGQRLEVGSPSLLGFTTKPVVVGTAFIDSVPEGPVLRAPYIRGARTANADYRVGGSARKIGTVVHVQGATLTYLVMRDGLFALTPFETKLFTAYPQVTVTAAQAAGARMTSTHTHDLASLSSLPKQPPPLDARSLERGGVCAVFDKADDAPRFALPANHPSRFDSRTPTQSMTSLHGRADKVKVPATKGMLAVPANTGSPYLIISDQGVRYAFGNGGLLAGFGYSASDAVRVPPALLTLIPFSKHGLTRGAALAAVSP